MVSSFFHIYSSLFVLMLFSDFFPSFCYSGDEDDEEMDPGEDPEVEEASSMLRQDFLEEWEGAEGPEEATNM